MSRSLACVVGYCTGGGDGASGTVTSHVLTLPTVGLNKAEPPKAGDWVIFLTGINANQTITGPTGTIDISATQNSANNNVNRLMRYQLLAADITAGTITITQSSTNRGTTVGVVVRGIDWTATVNGTPVNTADPPSATAAHSDECIALAWTSARSLSTPSAFTAPTGYTIGQNAVRTSANVAVDTAVASRNAATSPDEAVNPATWAETSASSFWSYTLILAPLWEVGWMGAAA